MHAGIILSDLLPENRLFNRSKQWVGNTYFGGIKLLSPIDGHSHCVNHKEAIVSYLVPGTQLAEALNRCTGGLLFFQPKKLLLSSIVSYNTQQLAEAQK